MPKRIQRRRVKGWKMPPNTVYVGRPTQWGNPYKVDAETTLDQSIELYRLDYDCLGDDEVVDICDDCACWQDRVIEALRGKDLACWCPLEQPCHADVLLEIANS